LFRAQMAAINAAQSRFQVSVRHNYPIPVRPPRWMAVCPSCKRRTPCRRRIRHAALPIVLQSASRGALASQLFVAL
jgi:hypothetical protein